MILSIVMAGLLLTGCGDESGPKYTEQTQAGTAGSAVTDSRPASNARLRILRPANEAVLETTRADIFFQTENFEIGGGNAIMVSLDNQPPRKHAVRNAPYVITGLSEGGHTVIAWLVGPDGLTVNSPHAKVSVHFYVKRKDFQNFLGSNETSVSINQPRGTYDGPRADQVMLDFKISNAPAGYLARYSVAGRTATVTSDAPVNLGILPAGSHTLTLEVLDAQGNPLPGSFAKAQSSFVVVRGAPPVAAPEGGNFQSPPPSLAPPPTPQTIPE
ncbi:hypothetical protein QQ056_12980 [Oscillatoria laete-virens NRMC-F 0139]|nr:hypothetical protein [Oscillatoria laete-virens NRMC-F 0139]